MRNRDNAMPVVVEDSTERSLLHADGTETRDYDATFHGDTVERMRLGYKCSFCWEELDDSEAPCTLCGRPLNERLLRFADTFDGEKWIGPTEPFAERLAADSEHRARENHRKSDSRIWVPGKEI